MVISLQNVWGLATWVTLIVNSQVPPPEIRSQQWKPRKNTFQKTCQEIPVQVVQGTEFEKYCFLFLRTVLTTYCTIKEQKQQQEAIWRLLDILIPKLVYYFNIKDALSCCAKVGYSSQIEGASLEQMLTFESSVFQTCSIY